MTGNGYLRIGGCCASKSIKIKLPLIEGTVLGGANVFTVYIVSKRIEAVTGGGSRFTGERAESLIHQKGFINVLLVAKAETLFVLLCELKIKLLEIQF